MVEEDRTAAFAANQGGGDADKKRQRKVKSGRGKSGLHAVLKECKLTEFEDALIAAGFTTAKDVSTEGHHMEQQLRQVGLNRGQAKKLMTHARRFTNKKKDNAKAAIDKRNLVSSSPSTGRRPRLSGDALRADPTEEKRLPNPSLSNSSDFFAGPEITGTGPESNDYTDQRALLVASGKVLSGEDTGFGAHTTKGLVEDNDQFLEYQMATAAAQIAQNPLMRLPPKLPSVDSHITRDELKFEHMASELRKARNKYLKRPRKKPMSDDSSLGSMADGGGFSIQEIRRVVNYIDDMNEDGTNDGRVDSNELTMAFRRARRARAGRKYEELGRNVVYKLEHLMTLQNMTPAQWFEHMDGGMNPNPGAKSDGRVTNLELRQGLAEMTSTKLFREYAFSEEELTNLLRYMDPNGDGDLDVQEVEDAIRRSHLDDAASAVEAEAGAIMQKLEDFMNEKHMRVIDLFMLLDEDGSGEITIHELRKGLINLAAPSASERAAAKRKRQQEAAALQESTLKEQQERELTERMEVAKQTGAIKVLSKIDHHMHKQNMRVKDLFSKSGFDKSGDGMLDVDEFCTALELLGVKFSKKETRVLVHFLDESGDGEIEAYELESALRRLRKDVAVLKEGKERDKQQQQPSHSTSTDSYGGYPSRKGVGKNKKESTQQQRGRKKGGTALAQMDSDAGSSVFSKSMTLTTSLPSLPPGIGHNSVSYVNFRRRNPPEKLKILTGSNFDTHWLGSFDKSIDKHLSRAFSQV